MVFFLSAASQAQTNYPNKPIRLVIPFTPGGSTDILGRAIGIELTKALGQAVVIDNVPGAGGSIGADKVAKAPADGYTLLMGHIGTLAVNPSLYPALSYKPLTDFAPIALVATVPNVLVVNPAVPATTVPALVALLKAKPAGLNYASGGNGSAAHIATEYFKLQTKTHIVHIPYRGTAPAVNDVLGGGVQMMFTGAPAVVQHIQSGRLRALAVSSTQRLDALPDVPTMQQLGYTGFEADQWYGVVAPANTPAAVVNLLNQTINQALQSAALKSRLNSEGAIAAPRSPAEFGKHIAAEIPRWAAVVRAGGVKAD